MWNWKGIIVATVIVVLFSAAIPAYASVIVSDPFSVGTSQVEPFVVISNNTSSIPQSQVQINQYGTEANVSVSGTWESSGLGTPKEVYGVASQVLLKGDNAYARVESADVSGYYNLSHLEVLFNGSTAASVEQTSLKSGTMTVYGNNVSFNRAVPMNLTISFAPSSHSTKPIQIEDAFLTLNILTYYPAGSSGVFIHERINIALTMTILG